MRLPHHNQILTGVLPYGSGNKVNLIKSIRNAKRPPRPMDPSQNRWLQDSVWDTIVMCWSNELDQRRELSAVYYVFSTSSPQGTQNAKSDRPGNFLHLEQQTSR
jgi:hypothetical protein